MRPFLTDIMITRVSCIGSILIFGLGLNLVLGSKIKIGNLLPAVFCLSLPVCWVFRDPEEGSEQDRDCQADTAAVIQRERMSHMKFAKRMDRFGEGIFQSWLKLKRKRAARERRSSISA